MGRITRPSGSNHTEFGRLVASILRQGGIPQAALATALDVKPAALSMVLTGARRASPEWVEAISDVIGATSEVRRNLHVAAARTVGYRIWLFEEPPSDRPSDGPGDAIHP